MRSHPPLRRVTCALALAALSACGGHSCGTGATRAEESPLLRGEPPQGLDPSLETGVHTLVVALQPETGDTCEYNGRCARLTLSSSRHPLACCEPVGADDPKHSQECRQLEDKYGEQGSNIGQLAMLDGGDTMIEATRLLAQYLGARHRSWKCYSMSQDRESRGVVDLGVTALHGGPCPGDPDVAPVTEQYRVDARHGTISKIDPRSGAYEAAP